MKYLLLGSGILEHTCIWLQMLPYDLLRLLTNCLIQDCLGVVMLQRMPHYNCRCIQDRFGKQTGNFDFQVALNMLEILLLHLHLEDRKQLAIYLDFQCAILEFEVLF